jgi:enoyl ACP reductase
MALLDGKKLLITGVLTDRSIAFSVARRAQEEGAEIVLTGFGRGLRLTQRMAGRLPSEPEVLELDVTDDAQVAAVAADLEARWGVLDGVLHAIAFVPSDALGGRFMEAPADSAKAAFEIGAFSLKTLGAAFAPLLEKAEDGGSLVGLDFDATKAWPIYDWAGVSKAALESVNRYLAQYLGPRGVRSNLVAAGPLRTMAAGAIDGFDVLASAWEEGAPLPWDLSDPDPVADACLFLLSRMSRAVTGEILHVDGGFHALGVHGGAVAAAAAQAADAE